MTNLPTLGRVNYNPVGGTSPTMSLNGQTGALLSGGQVAIDFGQATASPDRLASRLYECRLLDEREHFVNRRTIYGLCTDSELFRQRLPRHSRRKLRRIPNRQHRHRCWAGLQLRRDLGSGELHSRRRGLSTAIAHVLQLTPSKFRRSRCHQRWLQSGPIADGSRRPAAERQCCASQAGGTTTRNQCLYPLELITQPSDHRANFFETGDE
jgi:hypothetical protein